MARVEDLAYIAGVIDGEGSIGVYSTSKCKSSTLQVVINMTDQEAINLAYSMFGGKLYSQVGRAGDRRLYRWIVTGKRAQEVLVLIKPFIRVKRLQLEMALTFPISTQGVTLSDADKYLRQVIDFRLREMKRPNLKES